ncbi:lysophospholipid acyltransferase family protein [Sunxiuqinia sp. A32]|uniref:lysophospholipid acyltransferase family protein n=1 Tax=Sunxiuqinia sp. A32 TaxID=3461496 RepID=UPI004045BE41
MKKLSQKAVVGFLKAFSHLPFWAIYILSDFFYLIIYHVIGYRKKVVYTNLGNAFPEKNEKEIEQIAKNYYHHLCDLSLESIKLHHISYKELDKRLTFTGFDKINEYFKQGKSIILWGMHYNNWEWNSSIQRHIHHQLVMIFNPVRNNQEMEKFILGMRERFGGTSIPVHHSARTAMQFNRNERPGMLWLAADQTPFQTSQYWTTFLNQETPFFRGPDKIAHKTNQPIFFIYFQKTGRGKYHSDLIELFSEPAKEDPETIMMTYIEVVERIIKNKPDYWLWSHRRWKHKRSDDVSLTERMDVTEYLPKEFKNL